MQTELKNQTSTKSSVCSFEEETGLLILDDTGHTRMQWNKKNPDEVAAAKTRFDELRRQGYMAYTVNKAGDQGVVLHDFDPEAERIIMHKQTVGG